MSDKFNTVNRFQTFVSNHLVDVQALRSYSANPFND